MLPLHYASSVDYSPNPALKMLLGYGHENTRNNEASCASFAFVDAVVAYGASLCSCSLSWVSLYTNAALWTCQCSVWVDLSITFDHHTYFADVAGTPGCTLPVTSFFKLCNGPCNMIWPAVGANPATCGCKNACILWSLWTPFKTSGGSAEARGRCELARFWGKEGEVTSCFQQINSR